MHDAWYRVHPHPPLLSSMQLARHATRRTLHRASRLVQAMSAWSVKSRRAPSRHCRDARVYGHMTTAMHDIEYTPLPASQAVCGRMQVTLLSTRRTPRAWCKQCLCLVGEHPTCSLPALLGCEGLHSYRVRPCMTWVHPYAFAESTRGARIRVVLCNRHSPLPHILTQSC